MADEEKTTGGDTPTISEEESKAVQQAIVDGGLPSGEDEGKLKPTGEEGSAKEKPKPEDTGEETKVEPKVEKPPEGDVALQKIIEKYKGNPDEMAKALRGQLEVQGRQGSELGEARKQNQRSAEWFAWAQKNPAEAAKQLQGEANKGKVTSEELDEVFTDPDAFGKAVDKVVAARLQERDAQSQTQRALSEVYPEYGQTKQQRENVKIAVDSGEIGQDELYHLAALGYYSKQMIADAEAGAVKTHQETLARKRGEQPPAQISITGEPKTKEQQEKEAMTDAIVHHDDFAP